MTEEQRQKARERQKRYYEKNRDKALAASKKWNQQNKEKMNEAAKRFYERKKDDPVFLELNSLKTKAWASKNKDLVRKQSAKKRADKLNRKPQWVSQDELLKIKLLYKTCYFLQQKTKIEFHVDHICPLKGKTVSGLHVYSNLRIIPAKENLTKSNKFWS